MKWAKFPIAEELADIWAIFYEQHWQSKRTPPLILDVINIPSFEQLTVLCLEDRSIEQIF
jgi:hypothetical protein